MGFENPAGQMANQLITGGERILLTHRSAQLGDARDGLPAAGLSQRL